MEKLCNENAMVRLLEGGKIISKGVDQYDKDLLAVITAEPQKLQKILGNAFSKMKIKTGDVFLVWRLREMIAEGKLEAQGEWARGWKEIAIKLVGAAQPAGIAGETMA